MNFCGGEIDQQVEDTENLLSEAPMCGACVKVESEDQMENKMDNSICSNGTDPTACLQNTSRRKESKSEALTDSSYCTHRDFMESDIDGTNSLIGKRISMPTPKRTTGSRVTCPTPRVTPSSHKPGSALFTSSPSPILLNPISDAGWAGKPKPNLLCPTLERRDKTAPSEQLIDRLADGFRVRYVGGPGSQEWKGHILHLFLHADRTRLCVETNKLPEEKKDDLPDYVLELLVHKILKLEIKGGNHSRPRRTFSLVLQDGKCVTYYDFEARSTLEREVIVSTVIVLLDQACHTRLPMRLSSFPDSEIGREELVHVRGSVKDGSKYQSLEVGTKDQPILCSPSLQEEEKDTSAIAGMDALHLSPQQRTRIYNDDDGTETSLVIHLENTFSDESKDAQVSLQRAQLNKEISQDSFKGGETASRMGHKSSNSQVIAGNWCSDDVCTLALRDIADTCSGIFELKQGEPNCFPPNDVSPEQHALLEEYIASALGAPNAVYSYVMEKSVWDVESDGPRSFENRGTSRRIQNRANRLNAQAVRLRNLRNEMTFASALKHSQERMHYVQTTQSFDDTANHPTKGHLSKAASQAAERLHSSPLLQHVVDTMMLHDLDNKKDSENGSVAYYDSDPEDVKPRNIYKKAPRQVAAERDNFQVRGSERFSTKKVNSEFLDTIPSDKKVRKLDEDAVVEIVQTISNERLILMWHPTQSKTSPNRSPICVKVWIESGVYLVDGTFLLPKLTWIKASDDTKGTHVQGKYKQEQQKALQKFDLLDVCRICATDTIDRKLHPFASATKSFYIETGSEVFVMEAQNSQERDRIVYGLKLVIARLASLLMLRDMRAADEFFGASTVPGEAPRWAQGEQQQGDPTVNKAT